MKILFSSLSGHNQTESHDFVAVLQRLGHQVIRLTNPTPIHEPSPRFYIEPGYAYEVTLDALFSHLGGTPDLFIYMEPGGVIPKEMAVARIPTVAILCDTHRWLEARQRLARFCDHVFLYHRNYLAHFAEHPQENVHWLPYACDLELFKPIEVERDLDVAFVGQLKAATTGRALTIQRLANRYKMNEPKYYLREEIPGVYARAKIVLNMPLADDLNFRTFEAMSCGAMLLTRRVNNGQELLFQEGVHYAAYADEQEMFEKIDYYLAHPAERKGIAAAGLAEIQAHHCLEQRIAEILSIVQERPAPVAPIRRMTPTQIDREYAWLYEYWRAPEAGLRLVREARLAKRPWLPLLLPAVRSVLRVLFR
jgi:hypothetical protein